MFKWQKNIYTQVNYFSDMLPTLSGAGAAGLGLGASDLGGLGGGGFNPAALGGLASNNPFMAQLGAAASSSLLGAAGTISIS